MQTINIDLPWMIWKMILKNFPQKKLLNFFEYPIVPVEGVWMKTQVEG